MISPSYDFYEFFEAMKGKSYSEIICVANQELTEAERYIIRNKTSFDEEIGHCRSYADTLKSLIFFLRYRIKVYGLSDRSFLLFLLLLRRPPGQNPENLH